MSLSAAQSTWVSNTSTSATAKTTTTASTLRSCNNYSNVTISPVEDLGGGLKLDFALQVQTSNTNAGGNLTNRNSHIGLVSDHWGGVWYGTNEHIYERYLYTIDPIDGAAGLGGNLQILGQPGGQAFGLYGDASGGGNNTGYSFYRRDGQSIWYDSPNFNGFTFGVVWQTNFNATSNPDTDPMMFQLGVKYASPALPLEVWGAFAKRKDQFGLTFFKGSFGSGSDDTAMQLGAAYTLGDIKIFGGWENVEYELDDATTFRQWDRDAFYVGVKWNLATGYPAHSTFSTEADCKAATVTTLAQMIGVGYYHTLSSRPRLTSWAAGWTMTTPAPWYAGIGNQHGQPALACSVWVA